MAVRALKAPVPTYEETGAPSRSDHVYRYLREELMRGELKPHERLRIRDLAAKLSTSETPVREAIFQLVRDGAVELKPHSYVRVRRLSLVEYLEGRDIRLMLEPFAGERALDHVTTADIANLRKVHRSLIAAEKARDYQTAVLRNYDFHFGLYRRSGMTQVLDILETLWMRLGPMLNLYLYRDGTPYSGEGHQHEVVIEALERRDARALKKSIRDDMIEGGRNFVRVLTEAEALA
ncbi:MAG: GntR family transcriptional regulator [Hyphomicrobiales bacterium]